MIWERLIKVASSYSTVVHVRLLRGAPIGIVDFVIITTWVRCVPHPFTSCGRYGFSRRLIVVFSIQKLFSTIRVSMTGDAVHGVSKPGSSGYCFSLECSLIRMTSIGAFYLSRSIFSLHKYAGPVCCTNVIIRHICLCLLSLDRICTR